MCAFRLSAGICVLAINCHVIVCAQVERNHSEIFMSKVDAVVVGLKVEIAEVLDEYPLPGIMTIKFASKDACAELIDLDKELKKSSLFDKEVKERIEYRIDEHKAYIAMIYKMRDYDELRRAVATKKG